MFFHVTLSNYFEMYYKILQSHTAYSLARCCSTSVALGQGFVRTNVLLIQSKPQSPDAQKNTFIIRSSKESHGDVELKGLCGWFPWSDRLTRPMMPPGTDHVLLLNGE